MCGVVGYYPRSLRGIERIQAFGQLLRQSRVRGTHAYGMATWWADGRLATDKSSDIEEICGKFTGLNPVVAHCRYSTSGDWQNMRNNQPIVAGGRALVFNGVIHMGTKGEFEGEFGVQCESDNDGEVFLRLLERGDQTDADLRKSGLDVKSPGERADVEHVFTRCIDGSFAGLWLDQRGRLWVLRNERRPLWWVGDHLGASWYASTRDIFLRAGFPEPREVPPNVAEVEG